MNSLPPELLSSIVEQAAQCDSSYSSYKLRIRTLSALSLVNRTFRQLAQPLLPQKVWFKCENEVEEFRKIGKMGQVASLKYEYEERKFCHRSFEKFSFMTELRIHNVYWFDIMSLNGLQQLKRRSKVSLSLGIDFEHFALPSVEEVSLEEVNLFVEDLAASRTICFLAPSHFPSLRALGIKAFRCYNWIRTGGWSRVSIDYSLVNQLDCITLDENGYQDWTQSRQTNPGSSLSNSFSNPLLFNIDSTALPSSSVALVCTSAHVRLRLTSEFPPYRYQIDDALSLVQDLLTKATLLEEFYLDLYPLGGTRGYLLDGDLRRKIERVEVLAKEKKVEIIWETHKDDWCESTVSREFWRRCNEKKEKARKGE